MKYHLTLTLAGLFFLTIQLHAQVYTWDGSEGDNDWENDDNWTPPFYPDAGKTAIIPVSSSYPIITTGQLEQVSKLIIHTGATVTIQDDGYLEVYEGDSLINEGSIIIRDDGHLDVNDAFGTPVNAINSGTIIIQNTGDLTFSDSLNGEGLFLNTGTITIEGNGRLDVAWADTLLNSGDINVQDNGVFYAENIGDSLLNSGDIILTGNGTFRVKATGTTFYNSGNISITGNGAFQQESGSEYGNQGGSFTLTRTGINDLMRFNFWSSPVAAQNVNALTANGGNAYYFAPSLSRHEEDDDTADLGWLPAAGTMTAGVGYAGAGSDVVTFSGVPNNGDIPVTVEYNDSTLPGPGVPYNLIGNPYPSPLNLQEFFNVNGADLFTGAVYIWDSQTPEPFEISDYAILAPFGSITNNTGAGTYSSPPYYLSLATGQGFFVDVNSGSTSISFTNAMRTDHASDSTVFFKQTNLQRLWLGVTDADSTVYNELLMIFSQEATSGFDKMYDARKLKGNTKLSLYSLNNDQQYAIQGLPYLVQDEVKVPIGVSMNGNIAFTFALKWEESLEDFDIYLEDMQTGSITDMRNADHSVSLAGGEHNSRFSIVLTPKNATAIREPSVSVIEVNHDHGMLRIINKQDRTQVLESVLIYDIAGKQLQEWNRVPLKNMETLLLPFAPEHSGYYIVSISFENESVRQKIRIIN